MVGVGAAETNAAAKRKAVDKYFILNGTGQWRIWQSILKGARTRYIAAVGV